MLLWYHETTAAVKDGASPASDRGRQCSSSPPTSRSAQERVSPVRVGKRGSQQRHAWMTEMLAGLVTGRSCNPAGRAVSRPVRHSAEARHAREETLFKSAGMGESKYANLPSRTSPRRWRPVARHHENEGPAEGSAILAWRPQRRRVDQVRSFASMSQCMSAGGHGYPLRRHMNPAEFDQRLRTIRRSHCGRITSPPHTSRGYPFVNVTHGTDEEHFRKLGHVSLCTDQLFLRPTIRVSDSATEIDIPLRPEFFHAAHAVHGSVLPARWTTRRSLPCSAPDVFVLTASFNIYLTRPVVGGTLRDGTRGNRSPASFWRPSCAEE